MRLVTEIGQSEDLGCGDPAAVALAVKTLRQSAILPLSPADAKSLAKRVLRNTSVGLMSRKSIEVLLTTTPLDKGRVLAIDYSVAEAKRNEAVGIVALALDDEYERRLDALRTCPNPGTSRVAAFNALFARHCAAANHVVVYDRFVGAQLVRDGDRSGAAWFLSQLKGHGCTSVEVMTATEDGCDAVSIGVALSSLTPEHRSGNYSLLVTEQGSRMHDRHIRFDFGTTRGSEAITLGPGLDGFRSERLGQHLQAAVWPSRSAQAFEAWFRGTEPKVFRLGQGT